VWKVGRHSSGAVNSRVPLELIVMDDKFVEKAATVSMVDSLVTNPCRCFQDAVMAKIALLKLLWITTLQSIERLKA